MPKPKPKTQPKYGATPQQRAERFASSSPSDIAADTGINVGAIVARLDAENVSDQDLAALAAAALDAPPEA